MNKKIISSRNTIEGIKAILLFKRTYFTRTKTTKTHSSEQKKSNVLLHLKTSKEKKVAYSLIWTKNSILCA